MKNLLIFSDIHLYSSDLEECELIFNEIIELCEKYQIDTIISLGDNFDVVRPGALEINCFGNFIKRLGDRRIILLAAQSHESETLELSIVNIYGILKNNVEVVKDFSDGTHLFCGHFIVKEATKNFGATISKSELKYKYVFLGHQHSFQIVKPQICQLGSVRWIDFAESEDKEKKIAIILNYGEEGEKVQFIPLLSPIPMKDIELSRLSESEGITNPVLDKIVQPAQPELKNDRGNESISTFCQKLDQIDPKTKVRIIFKDYSSWVSFLPLYQKYKERFTKFVDKKDFIISLNNQKELKKDTTNLTELLNPWLEKNQVPEKIKEILLKEIK